MAITRRQFVTRMGALAAAMGLSQVDIAKIGEVFAHPSTTAWYQKPAVVWVHGAECTGCSTSLLSLFEDASKQAFEDTRISAASIKGALDIVAGSDIISGAPAGHPFSHRTLNNSHSSHPTLRAGADFDGAANSTPYIVNIADVLLDFISLEYHETVNGMAGDLAYRWLKDRIESGNTAPFVLVVEGAVQDSDSGGAWSDTAGIGQPWCSIGMDGSGNAVAEHSFDDVVTNLAKRADCLGVIAIGQCATFGGYPGSVPPGGEFTMSQTQARGTYYHLIAKGESAAAAKVVNVPGCPTNPWWFVLSVVAFLVEFYAPGAVPGILNMDATRRLKAVYGVPMHGPGCTRYADYNAGVFAAYPGDRGCLQLLGCKGPSTNSICTLHGWNAQQPHNDASWDYGVAGVLGNKKGGNCIAGGHPCMGCTEKGYPDSMVPFVVRR